MTPGASVTTVRTEPVVAVGADETVGPLRLRLLTAASTRMSLVVTAGDPAEPDYHVFVLAEVQPVLARELSATPLRQALDLTERPPRVPVTRATAGPGDVGAPVVEGGRVIGVVAPDRPEEPEFTEADMNRVPGGGDGAGAAAEGGDGGGRRRRWFGRRSG